MRARRRLDCLEHAQCMGFLRDNSNVSVQWFRQTCLAGPELFGMILEDENPTRGPLKLFKYQKTSNLVGHAHLHVGEFIYFIFFG